MEATSRLWSDIIQGLRVERLQLMDKLNHYILEENTPLHLRDISLVEIKNMKAEIQSRLDQINDLLNNWN